MKIECQVVQSLDAFKTLKNTWEILLSESCSNTIFMTWEWMYNWWKVFRKDHKLLLLLVRKNNDIIGIAPIFLKTNNHAGFKSRCLQFLGSEFVGSDYLNFIIKKNEEEIFFREFFNFLKNQAIWDSMILSDIPKDSKNINFIRTESNRLGYNLVLIDRKICPFTLLPGSWNEYLNNLSPSKRYDIRRKIRKIQKEQNIELEIISNGNLLKKSIDALIEMNVERLRFKSETGGFQDQDFTRFHQKIIPVFSDRDWVRLCFLKFQNNPIATLYIFKYNSTYYYYQSGMRMSYKRFSPSTVLFALIIKHAIESEKIKIFDFLQGEERYKYSWAKYIKQNISIAIFNNNITGNFNCLVSSSKQFAKNAGKYFFKRYNI
jgi:CelD/BcsL family acetyltransferase involved in cellulose biosynthesis